MHEKPTGCPTATTDAAAENARRLKVLVIRCCRAAEYARAVADVRKREPGAEVIALSHRGHRDTLLAAGVDRIIEVSGGRFGSLHTRPRDLLRVRREHVDEVVVPLMTAQVGAYSNVYRFAALLRTRRIVVRPGALPPLHFATGRALMRSVALRSLLGRWADAPLLLLVLAVACLKRRRTVTPGAPSERTRVLLIISSLGLGGAQVQLAELLNAMPASDVDVDLLALGADGDFSRQWLRRDDVTVSVLQEWPSLVKSVMEIANLCRGRRYDIVHTWLFMANVIGAAGARLAGVPTVIASVRNLSVWKRERWYRKWWHRAADVLASHAADIVTVNATALVQDHARWALMPARRIRVLPNGLDPSRLAIDRLAARQQLRAAIDAPGTAPLVGMVGRLAPEKDPETFIRLFSLVRKQIPDARAVVVGSGELRARLESVAAGLGLTSHLTFLGERRDARALIAGLDVLVLTSRSEGFPNVLLEAVFLGVPAVATRLAGNPDVLLYDELLFPVGDAAAGASRVLRVLDATHRTEQRTEALRTRAHTLFTSKRAVGRWLALYQECLARRGEEGAPLLPGRALEAEVR